MTYTDIYPQEGLQEIDGVEVVNHANDLPAPTNGVRQLADDTLYLFADVVEDPYRLRAGNNSPLVGFWASKSGYVTTGGGPAITSNGVPVFLDRMFLFAPAGQIFDLTASDTTELYVNKCSSANPAPGTLPNTASLGTINGFRVPTFEGCNFEHFNDGFTFTGTSKKIVFKFVPFRNVTASGVRIVELDAAASTEILKFDGCYVKDVQADTSVVYADPAATISIITRYANTDHDETVTRSNILNGQLGRDVVGVHVTDSFPLADSTAIGELQFQGSYAATGTGTATTELTPATDLLAGSERVRESSDGRLEYIGRGNETLRVRGTVTCTGVNDEIELAIAKNGTPINQPRTRISNNAASAQTTGSVAATVTMQTGDYVSVFGENVTSTADFTVTNLVVAI